MQDSRDFLLAAVRGVARANEHEWHSDVKTTNIRTELALDFVNPPEYVKPFYADKNMHHIKELMTQMPSREIVHLSYSAASAIVGILRYVSTGQMSPLPKWLFSNRPDLQQFEEVEEYKDFAAMEQETNRAEVVARWEKAEAERTKSI